MDCTEKLNEVKKQLDKIYKKNKINCNTVNSTDFINFKYEIVSLFIDTIWDIEKEVRHETSDRIIETYKKYYS